MSILLDKELTGLAVVQCSNSLWVVKARYKGRDFEAVNLESSSAVWRWLEWVMGTAAGIAYPGASVVK